MSEENVSPSEDRPVHPIQKLMDNPWLLLGIGLLITLLSYTAWGWFDIATLEPAKLP